MLIMFIMLIMFNLQHCITIFKESDLKAELLQLVMHYPSQIINVSQWKTKKGF